MNKRWRNPWSPATVKIGGHLLPKNHIDVKLFGTRIAEANNSSYWKLEDGTSIPVEFRLENENTGETFIVDGYYYRYSESDESGLYFWDYWGAEIEYCGEEITVEQNRENESPFQILGWRFKG